MDNYIWQNDNWPHFTFDSHILIPSMTTLLINIGILRGQMSLLDFKIQAKSIINRFSNEIKKSYEIEGADLSLFSVRSSVARHLGLENIILSNGDVLDKPHKSIDSVVNVIFDAVENSNSPLTKERLCGWNKQLFGNINSAYSNTGKINVGEYRNEAMYVLSGSMNTSVIHYVAPPANQISKEMDTFLEWFNKKAEDDNMNGIIKSAIAHLYFVSIHPFEDGNGRIARALSDMTLSRNSNNSFNISSNEENKRKYDHLFSMSAQLYKERKEYYNQLEIAQKGNLDIASWILWYIECMNRAVCSALEELVLVLKRKQFWEHVNKEKGINERMKKMLELLLYDFQGKLNSTKYAKICKCSQDTASRDLEKLVKLGILTKGEMRGKSTSYTLSL